MRKAFTPAELREMAQMLTMAKRAAPTRPHPRSPDTPPGNLVAGAMSAVLDMGKDAVEAARHKVEGLTSRRDKGSTKRRSSKRAKQGTGTSHHTNGAESHYIM